LHYAYRHKGLEGRRPQAHSDQGHARTLTLEQRALVLDIRRERPRASAHLIRWRIVRRSTWSFPFSMGPHMCVNPRS
jgi:hypothetical protein